MKSIHILIIYLFNIIRVSKDIAKSNASNTNISKNGQNDKNNKSNDDLKNEEKVNELNKNTTVISGLSCIIKLLKREGIKSLYSGALSAIFISVVQNGFYFLLKRFVKIINRNNFPALKQTPIIESFLNNTIAAFFVAIITNPLYVVNTRMASIGSEYKIENSQMIELIYNNEGIKGFFKGLGPSLILIINPIINFTIYDVLEKIIKSKHPGKGIKNTEIAFISFFAKFITTVLTYPITTYKTIKMSSFTSSSEDLSRGLNFFDILKKHGILSLYRGFLSKIIGSEINNVILMLTYENAKRIIKKILLGYLFKQ